MASSLPVRGAEAYRNTAAHAASPLELVVMLYDGAIRFLREARDAHHARDHAKRAIALGRTIAIVAECQSTLDLERGGTIAAELDRLYTYISTRLIDVTVKRDVTAIDEIERLFFTLRDGWAEAAIRNRATGSTTQPRSA